MGMLDTIMQMFKSQPTPQAQKTGTQTSPNSGATTKQLSMRDAYLQYNMQMQEQGLTPLPYDQWLAAQAAPQKEKK